jgi:hypothetical protein
MQSVTRRIDRTTCEKRRTRKNPTGAGRQRPPKPHHRIYPATLRDCPPHRSARDPRFLPDRPALAPSLPTLRQPDTPARRNTQTETRSWTGATFSSTYRRRGEPGAAPIIPRDRDRPSFGDIPSETPSWRSSSIPAPSSRSRPHRTANEYRHRTPPGHAQKSPRRSAPLGRLGAAGQKRRAARPIKPVSAAADPRKMRCYIISAIRRRSKSWNRSPEARDTAFSTRSPQLSNVLLVKGTMAGRSQSFV